MLAAAAWIGVIFVWLLVWMLICVYSTAMKSGDAYVRALGTILPGFVIASSICSFVIVHDHVETFRSIVLWMHHAAIAALFAFLVTSEYFQVEALKRSVQGKPVDDSYRRLWVLTETLPGPIALTILLTGLRLIWEDPQTYSPEHSWLLILIAGFSLFFWDGLLGFMPIVRRIWSRTKAAAHRAGGTSKLVLSGSDSVQLLLHFVSLPPLIAVGIARPHFANPVSNWISSLEGGLSFLPTGWPQATAAILIWLAIGVAVFAARMATGHLREYRASV